MGYKAYSGRSKAMSGGIIVQQNDRLLTESVQQLGVLADPPTTSFVDHEDNFLIWEYWMDGDKEGNEPIIELVPEVSCVPAHTEHQSWNVVLDFTFWAWRAWTYSNLFDSLHHEIFPFSRVRPDLFRWCWCGVHEEECGGRGIQRCWSVDWANIIVLVGAVAANLAASRIWRRSLRKQERAPLACGFQFQALFVCNVPTILTWKIVYY